MNGPHDMGGMQCYGAVVPEANEPVFHDAWEKRALALTVGVGFSGQWNIDISRHARECLPAEFYLSKSYYQIWIAGLQQLMLERGMVNEEELKTGQMQITPIPLQNIVPARDMEAALAAGGPANRDTGTSPSFDVGEHVKTLNIHPSGHTRLPRYARGKSGRIASIHGCHVLPDSNAHEGGENPTWLYSVEFSSVELFGLEAEVGNSVMIDCWETYFERA